MKIIEIELIVVVVVEAARVDVDKVGLVIVGVGTGNERKVIQPLAPRRETHESKASDMTEPTLSASAGGEPWQESQNWQFLICAARGSSDMLFRALHSLFQSYPPARPDVCVCV